MSVPHYVQGDAVDVEINSQTTPDIHGAKLKVEINPNSLIDDDVSTVSADNISPFSMFKSLAFDRFYGRGQFAIQAKHVSSDKSMIAPTANVISTSSRFGVLPDDLLHVVCGFLGADDHEAVAVLTRRHSQLVFPWQIKISTNAHRIKFLENFDSRFSRILDFTVTGRALPLRNPLTPLFNILSGLRELTLENCEELNDGNLAALSCLHKLEKLTLQGNTKITGSGFSQLSPPLAQLHTINIVACPKFGDLGLKALALAGYRSLLRVRFYESHNAEVTDDGVLALMEAAQSRGIKFTDFYCTGGSIARDHVAVGGMLELQLSGCHHVSDNVFAQLACLTPSLQSFRVSGCHDASITVSSSLTLLSLRGCSNLTEKGVSALRTLTLLCHLDLGHNDTLGDRALTKTLSSMTRLEVLLLDRCTALTSRGLRAISFLSNLTHLDLTSCREAVTNAVLMKSLPPGAPLTNLDLSQCGQLTDSVLKKLVRAYPGLRDVCVSCCEFVTSDGLRSIARLKSLTQLDLNYCYGVDDQGLLAISALPMLRSLLIVGCDVSTEGIKSLSSLQALKYLSFSLSQDRTDISEIVRALPPSCTVLAHHHGTHPHPENSDDDNISDDSDSDNDSDSDDSENDSNSSISDNRESGVDDFVDDCGEDASCNVKM